MAEADHGPAAVAMGEDEPAWLHFTSGTTGTPKAVVHSHAAGIGIHASAREALDLRAGDRFWSPPTRAGSRARCTASWRRCCMARRA